MAFVKVSDFSDSMEVVVFPKVFDEYRDLLEANKCVILQGKISSRNGEKGFLVNTVKELL